MTRSSNRVSTDSLVPRMALLLSTLALMLIGFIMVYSASSIEVINEGGSPISALTSQLMFAAVGIAAAVAFWRLVPWDWYRGIALRVGWWGSVILLVLTAIIGTAALGAQRWVQIGSVSFQPSEFAKIGILLMAAHVFALYREGVLDFKGLLVHGGVSVVAPVAFMFVAQSDLGTTIIMFIAILAVLWFGEVEMKYIVGGIALLILFALAAIFLTGYRSDRFVYLYPYNDGYDGYGGGYQIIHSYYAFANGGLFGAGLGSSREKFLYLPEAETDFIFAIIGEELGLIGAILVIVLFLVFLWAGLRIAQSASDIFGTMLAGGMTVMVVFQAFLNIGCVIGFLPTTGKPLPFISSGGTSLIATLMMVGIILAVSRASSGPSIYEKRRDDLRVIRGSGARG